MKCAIEIEHELGIGAQLGVPSILQYGKASYMIKVLQGVEAYAVTKADAVQLAMQCTSLHADGRVP